MTGREQGFLLLASGLGDPDRHPLSAAQLRTLAQRVAAASRSEEDRELSLEDLLALGYGREMAARILSLLDDGDVLADYLVRARRTGCVPLTWSSDGYPGDLRKRLGLESPGVLWAKGDLSILRGLRISLVGSRDIAPENLLFAKEAGRQAAVQGFTLVSGNARGADRAAQQSCLEAGGKVISVIADSMEEKREQKNVLYLCEDSFDFAFSSRRALSRNRVIHALGKAVLVAQCGDSSGGTWHGTAKNLERGWSPVCCFRDGSTACEKLELMGACPISIHDLFRLGDLSKPQMDLFAL